MIRAMVCDDHLLFGESFADALKCRGATVQVTAHPDETLAALQKAPVDRVVMNVRFPRGCGLTATRRIRRGWPQTQVFCLGVDSPDVRQAVTEAGAQALLSMKRPLAELVDTVMRGSHTPPCGGKQPPALGAQLRPVASSTRIEPLAARFLTKRERDVLQLLTRARPMHAIADELDISQTTARGYVQSILGKLGVHSRVEAVAYAIRHSVVQVSRGSG
jgi:two-component system nitrate/nitrite response regulator NarL